MKKFLALSMAAAMLTTVAFAGEDVYANKEGTNKLAAANPGDTIIFEMKDFVNDFKYKLNGDGEEQKEKTADLLNGNFFGEKLHKYDFNSDNFTLVAKFEKGAELVSKAYIDDDDNEVKIELKKDNTLKRPGDNKAPNLVIDKLEVKSRRTIKDDNKYSLKSGKTFVFNEGEESTKVNEDWKIGYSEEGETVISLDNEDFDLVLKNGKSGYVTVTGMDDDDAITDTNGDTFEPSTEAKSTMTYEPDGIDGIRIEGKVFAGDKFFIDVDNDYDNVMDVVKANDDADFDVYDITADGLSSTMKIWFDDLEEDNAYIYKYDPATKKLTKANAKFDEEELCYYTTFRGDTIFITCDEELNGVAASANNGANTNPETGR